ncbi:MULTISPECIES: DUF397 domain-containing protein [Actinomadura]|uniref:DUF397 domain-containing protein n=1 Tax=Actinomadura litoris TaxID=2678616 RepID=A0A7K1L7Q9_9ACTN|nr:MULTISPECIES: DUF397 domain-containing protein [Actinomadura]MBT2210547.1 DUF397 domain-containing protein [Actinomadura sp. NEAU-AAG7]MUN40459.1 DUF397 domain-containing protein [Actinomadura litoris]
MSTSDVSGIRWRKSSRSAHQGGECVEVADTTSTIMVRDSKNPDGPRLAFTPTAWQTFTNNIKAGRLDAEG